MLKHTTIDKLPLYFSDEEKKAFVDIYNALSPCKDALGIIPPEQGYKTVFLVTENLSVLRTTEEAIDAMLLNRPFLIETISHDETENMEGYVYAFR